MAKLNDEITVLSLNDDCLIEIFRLLSLPDFLSLFDTCKRFRSIAAQTFPLIHKKVDLNTIYRYLQSTELDRVTRFLRAFGDMITSLTFDILSKANDERCLKALDTVVNSCSGTLKSFNFRNGCTVFVKASMLRPLFASLESLTLRACRLDDNDLFADCKNLVDLSMSSAIHMNEYTSPFKSIHTQLSRLQLCGGILAATPAEDIARFFRYQNNLRELELSFY